ncbi:hypothetical protein KIN20_033036 [Parelaphostrongylus tenuis]|uniref:Uncharacterized protein n=1 Tax=Parelaphostrongylus tenuis TaxID=148309 RepID=A0AAD5WIJ4_PARTN|nr:hypothetical protein KIN20_033036 [Parelaphostrongylus tenuis]
MSSSAGRTLHLQFCGRDESGGSRQEEMWTSAGPPSEYDINSDDYIVFGREYLLIRKKYLRQFVFGNVSDAPLADPELQEPFCASNASNFVELGDRSSECFPE